jgi:hypothetical protein
VIDHDRPDLDDGADVIPLFPERDLTDGDRPVATESPRPLYCGHRRTRLESSSRRVFCRDCGREVDPYDVLAGIAHEVERWIGYRKEAERRAREAQERLDVLLREERNAKARARRRNAR